MRNPDEIHEREYYFDENMGVSIKQHADYLRSRIPGIKVESRRDRDGFAIIKTSIKRDYKYNIDDIIQYNTNFKSKELLKESLNGII